MTEHTNFDDELYQKNQENDDIWNIFNQVKQENKTSLKTEKETGTNNQIRLELELQSEKRNDLNNTPKCSNCLDVDIVAFFVFSMIENSSIISNTRRNFIILDFLCYR